MKQLRHMQMRPQVVIAISVILLSWMAAILAARNIPASAVKLTDHLFAVALGATYFGGWMLAVALARSKRQAFLRAAATTLTIIIIVLILEIPAAFKWVH